MRSSLWALPLATAALGLGGAPAQAVSIAIQPKPTARSNVQIQLSAPQLPDGGYYYAVVVLRPYRHFTGEVPPACATSSEMQRTDYGYPQPNGQVELTLTPARSDTGHWCRGGAYEGAAYAVPHPPPCEARYPCLVSEPYEPPPCPTHEGHPECGVVALPRWRYPERLPPPLASGTTMLSRFSVAFAAGTLRELHLSATVYDVSETVDGVVTSHESLTAHGRRGGEGFSTCTPGSPGAAHCTGKYALAGGTIRFAGTVAVPSRLARLTITGGSGRYARAEGTVLTERTPNGRRAEETITLEG